MRHRLDFKLTFQFASVLMQMAKYIFQILWGNNQEHSILIPNIIYYLPCPLPNSLPNGLNLSKTYVKSYNKLFYNPVLKFELVFFYK